MNKDVCRINARLGMFSCYEGAASAYTYDHSAQTYRLSANSSCAPWLYVKLAGDFIINTQLRALAAATSAGLELRSSNHCWQLALNAQGLAELVISHVDGTQLSCSDLGAADVLQVERKGNQLVFSYAQFGDCLSSLALDLLPLDETEAALAIGLYVRTDTHACSVDFYNLRLSIPAWEGLVPYTDYIGSHLEILDVATGARQIVYSTSAGIEAPNWTPDGRTLIYNSAGRLFSFDLATQTVSALDTGFALKNNNDHVLSFDGQQLAISHHSAEHQGKSIIYKLPASGGAPVQLTSQGPSYLHGWSPDNQFVIYTAERNGQFDIYRTDTQGSGVEIQLTNQPALDDGSEYSPDGLYIYFNSARTGTMQLWRMNADGSAPTQLTFDDYQNWFPHVSPDGQCLVFLSYLPEMQADKHPYYQHVYLRSLSLKEDAAEPQVIAYIYGGQGTINVPSWSPDSSRVAFVSNTCLAVD